MRTAILLTPCVLLFVVPTSAVQNKEAPVYRPGDGVSTPVLVTDRKPVYPAEAAGLDGLVKLECVVETNGSVGEVRVIKAVHPSLDAAAMTALKDWHFKPALKDGQPVRALVEVEMSFTWGDNLPRLDSIEVFKPGPGVTAPRVTREVKPEYPSAARQAGVQGTVVLDCVVRPDGRVGDTRVARSLDPVLDKQAIQAVKQWRFLPGERRNKPVPVQISIEIDFRLK